MALSMLFRFQTWVIKSTMENCCTASIATSKSQGLKAIASVCLCRRLRIADDFLAVFEDISWSHLALQSEGLLPLAAYRCNCVGGPWKYSI